MKKACAALALALLIAASGAARAEVVRLFYEEPCLTCDDGSVLNGAVALLAGLYDPEKARLEGINAFSRREELERAAAGRGLKLSSLELPAAFFPDGTVVAGERALQTELRAAYAALIGAEDAGATIPAVPAGQTALPAEKAACETDLTAAGENGFIWFLCTPGCEGCQTVKSLIDGAEAAGVGVRYVNCAADAETVRRLFALYGVPAERRYVPCALIGEAYLAGQEAVAAGIEAALLRGDARATRNLPEEKPLWIIAAAALALAAGGIGLYARKRRRAG